MITSIFRTATGGTPSAKPATAQANPPIRMTTVPARSGGTIVERAATNTEEDEFIRSMNEALSYDGFDVVKVRMAALSIMNIRTLITLLIAYIKVGNSLAAKIQRNAVVDRQKASEVLNLMKQSGVQIRATGSSGLSLPRLAIAYAGVVVHLRYKMKLAPRVDTTTPIHYQDLCLNGYTNVIPAAEDFIKKFNWVLTQASNRKKTGQKGFVAITEQASFDKLVSFRLIAVSNQALDPIGVKILTGLSFADSVSSTVELYGYSGGFTMFTEVNSMAVSELKAAEEAKARLQAAAAEQQEEQNAEETGVGEEKAAESPEEEQESTAGAVGDGL